MTIPNLKVVVHHFGSIVPTLEGRVGPGWDQLGSRTSDEDYGALLKSLKKRPLDYFKHNFYPTPPTFTSEGAMKLGFGFFDFDKVIFASDCPFDPEKGTMYIRETHPHPRRLRNAEGRPRQGLLQEPRKDHRQDVREIRLLRAYFRPEEAAVLRACRRGLSPAISFSREGLLDSRPWTLNQTIADRRRRTMPASRR